MTTMVLSFLSIMIPAGFVKYRRLGPTPRVSKLAGPGHSLRIGTSYKFSGVADLLTWEAILAEARRQTDYAGAQALISEGFCPNTLVRGRI